MLEAARNVACAGGEPLAFTDCLNFGNPERGEIGWELAEAIEGIAEACDALGLPIVSGNVSLYNETEGGPIYPTPEVGCVGLVADVRLVPGHWREGDDIFVAGHPAISLSGSEYQALFGEVGGRPAPLDLVAEAALIALSLAHSPTAFPRTRRLRGWSRGVPCRSGDHERDRRRARPPRRPRLAVRRGRRSGGDRVRAGGRRVARGRGADATREGRGSYNSRAPCGCVARGLGHLGMCGVFGIRSEERDVSRLAYFGLFALQHRGQESAGIAVAENGRLTAVRELGLVSQVFDEQTLRGLRGEIAIGHTRYSTTGSTHWVNAQPIVVHGRSRTVALGHNGNLINAEEVREELADTGIALRSTSDTEVIAALIANDEAPLAEAVANAMAKLEGAFTVTAISDGKLVAFRDPHGFRPLCLGASPATRWSRPRAAHSISWVPSSSERSLRGELVVIDEDGVHARQAVPPEGPGKFCIFEFFYLARPDSTIAGVEIHGARVRMGERLASEAPAEADLVMPIPDSGTPAAIGFSRASGIPFHEGLIKNRYVGRTFIQPEQGMREQGIRVKYNPLTDVAGKRVVIVDDSIVRGNTMRQLVSMLHDAGATEVHVRISSPPIVSPCFYGIDFGDAGRAHRIRPLGRGGARRDRSHVARLPVARGPAGVDVAARVGVLPRMSHAGISDAGSRGAKAREDAVRAQPRLSDWARDLATAPGPSPPWRCRG